MLFSLNFNKLNHQNDINQILKSEIDIIIFQIEYKN